MTQERLPPAMLFRSIFRGRLVYAAMAWVLEDTPERVVSVSLPGDAMRVPVGGRLELLKDMADGTIQTEPRLWHTHHVVWITPLNGARYALGHFWNAETGEFKGYYVNLQTPSRRSRFGLDACDQVLDILVSRDGTWRWKDEDEFEFAVRLGIFSPSEAATIRAEGERVIAELPKLIPTGWESWRPDSPWPQLTMPNGWDDMQA